MTSSRRVIVVCTLAAAAGLVGAPGVAHAQRTAADLESARQLYGQGIELRDKGDTKGALEKFRAAHALGNTPVTGIELCKAHAALHQPVEAREVCLGVARIPPLPQETSRSRDARFEAGTLAEEQRAKMAALRVVVKGVPAGREPTVTVDGVTLPPAALTEPRAVNPGVHVVTARVGQGAETQATLETREGETRDVELVVPAPPAAVEPLPAASPLPATSAPPSQKPEKKPNALAIVSFSVAGVAAAAGTITGIMTMNAESSLAELCPDQACGREDHEQLRDARATGTASTLLFLIAGVAAGGGILALVTGSPKAAVAPRPAAKAAKAKPTFTPTFGLGGVGIHGSF